MRFGKTTGGCLFSLGTIFFGGMLLMLNGGVVAAVYFGLLGDGPAWMRNAQITQFFMFTGPVVLLTIQWTVFDWLSAYRHAESRREQRWRRKTSTEKHV